MIIMNFPLLTHTNKIHTHSLSHNILKITHRLMIVELDVWTCSILKSLKNLPDVQAGFRKGRGTRNQIANIHWIMEKTREFQKNIYFCFTDYAKAFDCVDQNKLWKILKEMGIPDHLTCLLRNLYAGEEATVSTWNNRLVPNRKRSTSKLYIVTLLI